MLTDELCKQAYKGITAPKGLTNNDKIPYILLRELYREYKYKEIPEEIARKLKDKIQVYCELQPKEQLSLVYHLYPSILGLLKGNNEPAYNDLLDLFIEMASLIKPHE